MAAAGVGLGFQSCSEGYGRAQDSAAQRQSAHQNAYDGYQCALTGNCNPTPYLEQSRQKYRDSLESATDAVRGIGSSVPGSSITGPIPTSSADIIMYGGGNVAAEAMSND